MGARIMHLFSALLVLAGSVIAQTSDVPVAASSGDIVYNGGAR